MIRIFGFEKNKNSNNKPKTNIKDKVKRLDKIVIRFKNIID
ncbi:MAG: hypothetical protein AAB732_02720 [Patescibacteria group bacterium]